MKFKSIISAILSLTLSLSVFSVNSVADETDVQINTIGIVDGSDSGSSSLKSTYTNSFSLDGIDIREDNLNVVPNDSLGGISTYSNSAPVAGLAYIVANTDSLVNDKLSTETIIYWLWSDGTNNFTYDPDGDEIANYVVGGINDYIIGSVKLGSKICGFATQITEAGQHNLTFYVTDVNGKKSNTISEWINIEPADGNSRPICLVRQPSNLTPKINERVIFNFADSYDPDHDRITDVRYRISNDMGYEHNFGDYHVITNENGMVLKFPEEGTYEIMLSVSDSKGAWSNWSVTTVEVSGEFEDNEGDTILLSENDWVDEKVVKSDAYHAINCRIARNTEVYVTPENSGFYYKYTNHNGIYYNVAYSKIPAGTVFSTKEYWAPSSAGESNILDPVFGKSTPRKLSDGEYEILYNPDEFAEYNIYTPNYIVYDPVTLEIIDFYSDLNLLIKTGWVTRPVGI